MRIALPRSRGRVVTAPEQARRDSEIESAFTRVRAKGEDLELVGGERLILRSPDGSRWSITVDNAGTITATAI